jgi:hypothetical protein
MREPKNRSAAQAKNLPALTVKIEPVHQVYPARVKLLKVAPIGFALTVLRKAVMPVKLAQKALVLEIQIPTLLAAFAAESRTNNRN